MPFSNRVAEWLRVREPAYRAWFEANTERIALCAPSDKSEYQRYLTAIHEAFDAGWDASITPKETRRETCATRP